MHSARGLDSGEGKARWYEEGSGRMVAPLCRGLWIGLASGEVGQRARVIVLCLEVFTVEVDIAVGHRKSGMS